MGLGNHSSEGGEKEGGRKKGRWSISGIVSIRCYPGYDEAWTIGPSAACLELLCVPTGEIRNIMQDQ